MVCCNDWSGSRHFFGAQVSVLNLGEVVEELIHRLQAGIGARVMSLNLTMLRRVDYEYMTFARDYEFVTIDGRGMSLAMRLTGMGAVPQVAISDLSTELLACADSSHFSVFLLGATSGNNDLAVKRSRQRFPGAEISGHHGYFEESKMHDVLADLRKVDPQVVLVGMPSPKKERVINILHHHLPQSILVACGGYIDTLAGRSRRAPRWIQRAGLEWVYRFVQEPRRMLRLMLLDGLYAAMFLWPALLYFKLLGRKISLDRIVRLMKG